MPMIIDGADLGMTFKTNDDSAMLFKRPTDVVISLEVTSRNRSPS